MARRNGLAFLLGAAVPWMAGLFFGGALLNLAFSMESAGIRERADREAELIDRLIDANVKNRAILKQQDAVIAAYEKQHRGVVPENPESRKAVTTLADNLREAHNTQREIAQTVEHGLITLHVTRKDVLLRGLLTEKSVWMNCGVVGASVLGLGLGLAVLVLANRVWRDVITDALQKRIIGWAECRRWRKRLGAKEADLEAEKLRVPGLVAEKINIERPKLRASLREELEAEARGLDAKRAEVERELETVRAERERLRADLECAEQVRGDRIAAETMASEANRKAATFDERENSLRKRAEYLLQILDLFPSVVKARPEVMREYMSVRQLLAAYIR